MKQNPQSFKYREMKLKKKSSIKIKWNKIIRDENENENKSRKE
jgi:hypothetical protein